MLAAASERVGAWLVQVSSDYVFDGAQSRPYSPAAATNPLNVYGRTKLQGEQAVARALPAHSTVVRTSWLYAAEGRNFLTTMLRLMRDRPQLTVVSDQIGAPTSVTGLARVLWAFTRRRAPGLYHWCDSGVASWYDFAVAIAVANTAKRPCMVPLRAAMRPSWLCLAVGLSAADFCQRVFMASSGQYTAGSSGSLR